MKRNDAPRCPVCDKRRDILKFEDAYGPGDCRRMIVTHADNKRTPCVRTLPDMMRLSVAARQIGRSREALYQAARSRNGRQPLLKTKFDPITLCKVTTPLALARYVEATAWHTGGWQADRPRKGATK